MRAHQRAFHRTTLFALLAGAALALACEEQAAQVVFFAQRFDAEAKCLQPDEPVQTYASREARLGCPAACVTLRDTLYVTTSCPPYPPEAVLEASDGGACAEALSLHAAQETCGAEEEEDAAADADRPRFSKDAGPEEASDADAAVVTDADAGET